MTKNIEQQQNLSNTPKIRKPAFTALLICLDEPAIEQPGIGEVPIAPERRAQTEGARRAGRIIL